MAKDAFPNGAIALLVEGMPVNEKDASVVDGLFLEVDLNKLVQQYQ